MNLTARIETCHRCARAAGSRSACPADGVSLSTHAEAAYCPLTLYGDGNRPAAFPETAAEELAALKARAEAARRSQAVPEAEWPLAVKALARMRAGGEMGVGDTTKRLLAWIGAESMAAAYRKLTGKDCGCADKAAKLNALYPYATAG